MHALSASDPIQMLVPLLIGTFCLGSVFASIFFSQWVTPIQSLRRLPRLEYKINLIMKHLGIDDSIDTVAILRELGKGNKINAIKLYKAQTGVGLKEAKDAIDALERGDFAALEHSNGTA